MKTPKLSLIWMCSASTIASAGSAFAQNQSPDAAAAQGGIPEIIVTAQKRQESIIDVGMSINNITGDDLMKVGVQNARDLSKVVPGFSFAESAVGTPVYTIRGIGYFDTSLAASPTVSFYQDEIPLPYPVMTRGDPIDLERVEVLKGPQGTLFGQNSTGGAINFIAAKPTRDLTFGGDVGFGSYNEFSGSAFVSGPLSDTLRVRVAAGTQQRTRGWQKSYTRDDRLGKSDKSRGRILFDWTPTERLKIGLSLSGWLDKSDTQAPQLVALSLQRPATASNALKNYPLSPLSNKSADWSTNYPRNRDDTFYQIALRGDYDLTDGITLTSLTTYNHLKSDASYDGDGMTLNDVDYQPHGLVKTFHQELRLSGETSRLNWIVGANYERDKITDDTFNDITDASQVSLFGIAFNKTSITSRTDARTYAAFANVEYEITDNLKLQGGIRYTDDKREFVSCTADAGNGGLAQVFTILSGAFKGSPLVPPLGLGDCIALNAQFIPSAGTGTLHEKNVSWRAGLNYKVTPDTLLYANISRGYKNGGFPGISASSTIQYKPAVQETVLAYEAGFKSSILDRRLQLNGALFYYDYKDKQLLGAIDAAPFGKLNALVNIPKSRAYGGEFSIVAQPSNALRVMLSANYLSSKVQVYTGYDSLGIMRNLAGTHFPFAPEWTLMADAEYTFNAGASTEWFVGGTVNYRTSTYGGIGDQTVLKIDGYTLADLRAGVRWGNGAWQAMGFARNVGNTYYWSNVGKQQDGIVRWTGMPATYGINLSYRFK